MSPTCFRLSLAPTGLVSEAKGCPAMNALGALGALTKNIVEFEPPRRPDVSRLIG